MIKKLFGRFHSLTLWPRGKGTLNKLRLLLVGVLLQFPRSMRGDRFILFLNRILCGIIMQGAYGRLFYILSYDDLIHIDQDFEEVIKEWFDIYGGTFIDAGANIGRYTIGLAENFDKVYAFEPVRETFMTLKKNIHLNGLENVTAIQIGLWNCSDEKEISIGILKGLSSIVMSIPRSQTQKVVVNTCDSIAESFDIHDVSLIKIDAEGAEVEIIDGMKKLLLRDSPRIIVEVKSINRKKVREMLKRLGYTLIEVRGENHLFEII